MHTCTRFDLLNDRNLAQFYAACRTRNIATVEFALEKKFPINSSIKSTSTDFLGDTALHLAAKAFDTSVPCSDFEDFDRIIEQLFSYGADVTRINAATYSPIHIAFRLRMKYRTNSLPALLAGHGYNQPNVTDQHGLSHFHIACYCDKKNLVENFLNHGVAVNSKCGQYSKDSSDCGLTGLHFAAEESSIETVKLLLKYKADVNVKNHRGFNPLRSLREWQATFKNNTESALLLTGDYQEDCFNDVELFKLFHACRNENFNKLRSALATKPEIIRASVSNDSPYWPGYTLLHFAANFQIVSVVELLLNYTTRDDVNLTDAKRLTPLHCLLDSYLDGNEKGNQVDTILLIAKYLVQCGANLNLKGCNGLTPIDYALVRAREFKIEKFMQTFFEILGLSKFSDQEELNELFYACLEADCDYVEKLAKGGRLKKLINMPTGSAVPHSLQGFIPLHFAIHGGENKIVKLLLENGADFCAQNSRGLTPLHLAERAGSYSIVKLILKFHLTKVANPVDQGGLSHLHIACKHSAIKVAQILIVSQINTSSIITTNVQDKHDHDVYTIYTEGDSALHVIAKKGICDKITVGLFLNYGADYTLKNADATTPLHLFFTESRRRDILDDILSSSKRKLENLMDNGGWSYFYIACWMGKPNIVKEFLQKEKILVNEDDNPYKETPLHAAMYSKCLQVVQILVDHDAKVNALNNEGRTPLHYALTIPKDHEHKNEIINCLLSKLKVEEKKSVDNTGLTLLHIATIQNDTKTMTRLLKLGSDVNSAINLNSPLWPGFTALHLAVGFQCTDATKLLLDEGADWTVKTKNGIFPFGFTTTQIARQAEMVASLDDTEDGCQTILAVILRSNKFSKIMNVPVVNHRSIFHLFCQARDEKAIETMLELEANLHCPVDFFSSEYPGYTALHFAVDSGCLKTVKILINHGANVNAEDSFGWTPVHLACAQSSCEILKLLILKGAYINGRVIKYESNVGYSPEYELATPLHICASLEKIDFFQFLLKNGADICLTNAAGKNAFSMAHSRDAAMKPIIKMHFQILVFFDCSINDQFDNYGDHPFNIRSMPENLMNECQKLLNDKTLVGKYATLSDLITATPRKMYQLMKQTKLQQILYSDELDEKYPNCGFILKLQFQKGLEYKALVQNTMCMISPFVKYYLPLPELCIEKILEKLDGDDLQNLVEISNSIILNRTWFH